MSQHDWQDYWPTEKDLLQYPDLKGSGWQRCSRCGLFAHLSAMFDGCTVTERGEDGA